VLRAAGAAGASVLLAVDGMLHGERRRARFFGRNADVPLMLLAIGSADSIGRALPELGRLIDEPVATIERVQVWKTQGAAVGEPGGADRRGRARHERARPRDARGEGRGRRGSARARGSALAR
jgi:PII-like signaling protein